MKRILMILVFLMCSNVFAQQAPMVSIDATGTWKPYMIAYKIIKEMKNLKIGDVVEIITKDNKAMSEDVKTWCNATGNVFIGSEKKKDNTLSLFVGKGEAKINDHKMTVVISTANLEHVLFPLDKALSGVMLGMKGNVVFEGSGVRLLKKDYKSKLSGFFGGIFTGMVRKVMKKEIGWPEPQESIAILEELGANFYICGPSMARYGVEEEKIKVKKYTIAAVITTTELLANSDVHIFSKAEFEKP